MLLGTQGRGVASQTFHELARVTPQGTESQP